MINYFNKIAILVTSLLFLTGNPAFSQLHSKSKKAISHYNVALQSYRLMDYQKAGEEMEQALKIDPDFIEVHLLQAEMFTEQKNFEKAISSYSEVLRIDPDFFWNAWYNMGRLEVLTGKYDAAKVHLETFLSVPVKSKSLLQKAQKNLNICEFALKAMENPVPFEPENLGPSINSENDEYWPSLSADESIMVFTMLLPIDARNPVTRANRQEDLYYSRYEDGAWQPARNAGKPLNTYDNEGAQSISGNGRFMVFTACGRKDGYGLCDLYFSVWKKGSWSVPVNMGPAINSKHSE